MIGLLVFLAIVFGYVATATALTPAIYRRLRGRVPNALSYHEPNTSARNWSYLYAWLWPVGLFLVAARISMQRVDDRAELDKRERAELDRFRAEAMREVEGL